MTKQELRAQFAAKRAALDSAEKARLDAAVIRVIAQSEPFRQAGTLFAYYPVRGEIDLRPLFALAKEQGKTVALPVCGQGALRFRADTGTTRPGAFGIPVPTGPTVRPDEGTLCILPGYAYDASKRRLGYGGGCYDRFLPGFPGIGMGAFYRAFSLDALPADPFDVPCDLIATEEGIF